MIPPANGIDYRVHIGYLYMSPVGVPEEEIAARVPEFLERAGHYFANWPDAPGELGSQDQGDDRRARGADLRAAARPGPDGGHHRRQAGHGPHLSSPRTTTARSSWRYRACQYHFEFLNLGYVAYLDFFGFCKEAFPGIPDQGIAKMVQGIEVELFRPDDELKKLARLAVELDVAGPLSRGTVDGGARGRRRRATRGRVGRRLGGGQGPVVQLHLRQRHVQPRQVVARPPRHPARVRPRLHRAAWRRARTSLGRPSRSPPSATGSRPSTARCCPTTRRARRSTRSSGCRRMVFPYVENHNFYIEHWTMARVLAQDPQARPGVRRRGVLGRGGRHALPAPRRGPDRALRPRQRLGRRRRHRWASTTGRRSSPGARRSSRACRRRPRRRR